MTEAAAGGGAAKAWLGLGSNLGARRANLAAAVAALHGVVYVEAVSDIVETPPFGHADQPDFLNLVVRGRTTLPPLQLLSEVKRLEQQLGRMPSFRMGPRSIDIDVLVYDDVVIDVPGLTLPHPGIPQRPFVLVPLLQLDPALTSPVDGLPWARFLDHEARAGVRAAGRLDESES